MDIWIWFMAAVGTAFFVGAVFGRMLANDEIAKLREQLDKATDVAREIKNELQEIHTLVR